MKNTSVRITVAFLTISLLSEALLPEALLSEAMAIDEITRKGAEKPTRGDIQLVTRDEVTIKSGIADPVKIPSNEIIDVEWSGEPAELNLARGFEANGNFTDAIARYEKSAADKALSKKEIKIDIAFLIARATARKALEVDPSTLDAAVAKMDSFVKNNKNSFRYFAAISILGELQLAKKDYVAAETTFSQLATAPWADYKMAAQIAKGRLALARNDLDAALASYEAVLSQSPKGAAEISRRNEALLGKAAVQIAKKDAAAALVAISQAIKSASPEDSVVQAQAYVLKGNALKDQGKTKEAILAYLHVPVLFEKEATLNAEALYNLAVLWPQVDQPQRGAQASADLQANYPNSTWTKKLGN
jgi:tetratricopeptide (TPR) repeat protein